MFSRNPSGKMLYLALKALLGHTLDSKIMSSVFVMIIYGNGELTLIVLHAPMCLPIVSPIHLVQISKKNLLFKKERIEKRKYFFNVTLLVC